MRTSDHRGQAVQATAARRAEELSELIGFAERIAGGWADQLKVARDAVTWVAIKGGCRTPISTAGAQAAVYQLENEPGVAFALGTPGVMDLLFVVTRRGAAYSVNISNSARQWDRSECHLVRPTISQDLKRLLASAARYAQLGRPQAPTL
jgi:hypothetical protein